MAFRNIGDIKDDNIVYADNISYKKPESTSILHKCPHCGVQVVIRYDESEHFISEQEGYIFRCHWSIWHGNYDGGCPGALIHHQWFISEEAAVARWNTYCERINKYENLGIDC